MSTEANKETLDFQTEVRQLLDLMIHSLYSNREIFLRELISNASDAADKLRFEGLKDDSLFEDDPDLKIRVEFNKEQKTVSISDNGIGIEPDKLKRIFDTFYSTKPDRGKGVGLSLSKKIIEMYGGEITVKSDLDKGATFIISLKRYNNEGFSGS